VLRVLEASTLKWAKGAGFSWYLGRSQVVGCRWCWLFPETAMYEIALYRGFPKTALKPAPQHLEGRLPCSWYNYSTEKEVAA
jgi:hypothetical protein